ncbi:CDP-diacylglycerol diphosphatase [Polynucleobacter arcticus]|uniref:CDP-diacylglycerol pyrophosphatase n=1 Tax=Polynucleobacter arcticus TaxID=1743165 RepID=A0A6M9PJD9_9BURK|nr:CDP-diacylglycerol diphosphatase [Polynucleobacter arcticus]QKM60072.1 hypothetical protein DN92_02915 [Polynucleobacter arcticus]
MNIIKGLKLFAILSIFIFVLIGKSNAIDMASSDVLLNVATKCVDSKVKNYCGDCVSPRMDAYCDGANVCNKTIDVWSENSQFVAIREAKMCGCPKGFIHGLAMPRVPITGVEDPKRREEIWVFAWKAAKDQIKTGSIALAANPKTYRSQNQLHIHLARLDENAAAKFSQYSHAYVDDLTNVWGVADRIASKSNLKVYGVLVTQSAPGQYMILVTPESPEKEFLIWSCK